MIRFSAVSTCLCCAVLAAGVAHAQSYPTYGGNAYGYGPPPQAAMYPPAGMDPRMMPPGGPGMMPGMMPPGGAGMMPPGMMPPGMMPPGGGGMMQPSMEPGMQGGMGGAMNVTPGHYKVKADGPAPMKLPRGVSAADGLLYYNGTPYGQPINQYPVQNAAYEQSADGAGPQARTADASAYAGAMNGGCSDGSCGGNCGGAGGGCGPETSCFGSGPIFGFPGKYGYVWTATFDVLAMTRDSATDRVLVQNTSSGDSVFNSSSLGFDWVAGGRAKLKLMGPSGIAYEGTYMKLATLIADGQVDGNNNLQLPNPFGGNSTDYFGADQMQFHYTSEIQSAEFNIIYPFGNFQLLGGYRYFAMDESLRIRSSDFDDGFTSDFNTDCDNKMNGGQIGILGQWQLFGMLNFDFDAKFGIFADDVTQRQVARDADNSTIIRNTVGTDTGVAYVTELGIRAVVPLGASLNVHCGYNVFFIDRVALAPDQIDFSDNSLSGTRVHQNGDVVLQGVVLGLDARW